MTIIPSIDDLEAHGFWTTRLRDALGDFGIARTLLELELGKLPSSYRDRLEALAASAGHVEARLTWLTDIQAERRRCAAEWVAACRDTVETVAATQN